MTESYREIIKNNNFRFENYKLACKELDEKVKTGKSKLLQLDEWNRHFAFHKESNAIVIDVIRDTPLPKINKRKRIKGKWTMLIQSILYDAFSKQMEETGTYEIKGTKKDYMKLLGLCSPFYLKARYKTLADMLNEADDDEFKSNLTCYLKAYHIDDDVWLDFCLKVERAFTNIISNAFKSLEDHNLISSDSVSQIVNLMKSYTTYHIWRLHKNYLSKIFWRDKTFWTDGYFACSIGNVSENTLRKYIQNQG